MHQIKDFKNTVRAQFSLSVTAELYFSLLTSIAIFLLTVKSSTDPSLPSSASLLSDSC